MPTYSTEKKKGNETEIHPAKPHKKQHEKHHEKPHPGHHEKKPQPRGRGVELVGDQEEFLRRLMTKTADRDWAAEQMADEGPDHKQVHAALLSRRMSALIKVLEKDSATLFEIQSGNKLTSTRHGETRTTPLILPKASLDGTDRKEVLKVLSRAPEHELVLFASLLQSLEWAISVLSKKVAV